MIELMIADDNVQFAEHLHYMLTKEKDFKVINVSNNGLETIMYYNSLHPNILLLDLDMPGIDGLSVIEKLSDDKKNIIIMSGSSENRSRIRDTHRVEWIFEKPFNYSKLVEVIKDIDKSQKSEKFEFILDKILKKLLFDSLSKGTIFLKTAILIAYTTPKDFIEIDEIMKEVAFRYEIKNYKSLRSTIDKCIASTFIKHEKLDVFYEIFPEFDGYKPSIKQFIEGVLDYFNISMYNIY